MEKFEIELLGSENYSTWREDIKVILMDRDLWEVVNGTEIPPKEDAPPKEVKEFKSRNAKAYSTIYLGISKEYRILISNTSEGTEAWTIIENHFRPESRARVIGLTDKFFCCRIEDGEEIGLFAARMRQITSQLLDAGKPIDEWYQAFQLIRYLPPEFGSIVQSIYRWTEEQFKFNLVLSELLAEEARLKQSREDQDAVVLNNVQSRQMRGSRACQVKGRGNKSSTENMKKCSHCKKKGHLFNECWARKNSEKQKDKGNSRRKSGNNNLIIETSLTIKKVGRDVWVFDTAASNHFCCDLSWFTDYEKVKNTTMSVAVEGVTCRVEAIGTVHLKFPGKNTSDIYLKKVMYSPKLRRNLMAGPMIDKSGGSFIGKKGRINITRKDGSLMATAYLKNGLYYLYPNRKNISEKESKKTCSFKENKNYKSKGCKVKKSKGLAVENLNTTNEENISWHKRFAHVNQDYITKTGKYEAVIGLPKFSKKYEGFKCEVCKLAKTRRKSFKSVGKIRSNQPLELLHMDVCGPLPNKSIGGHKYFLTITDDFSRKVYVYPMKEKGEALECFRKYQLRAERFTNRKIKNIRTDNGMEFCHGKFVKFLEDQGIRAERTNIYTPEQNGVSERFNYTAMDGVKALLKESNLGDKFWTEALLCFTYVWNRLCHGNEQKTPFEKYGGKKPSVRHLKIFGARAYVGVPKQLRTKLQMRSKIGVMVGYALQTRGYRIWLPKERKIIETINVNFDEENVRSGAVMGPTPFSTPETNSEDETSSEQSESESQGETQVKIEQESSEEESSASELESKTQGSSKFQAEKVKRTKSSEESSLSESEDLDRTIPQDPLTTSKQTQISWFRKAVPRRDKSRTDIFYYLKGDKTRLRSINDVKKLCQAKNLPIDTEIFDFSGKNHFTGDVVQVENNVI